MLTQCPAVQPYTLDIQLRAAAQDNEGITNMFYDGVAKYQLDRDDCSAIAFDSAAYNEAAWDLMKSYFRLAVPIFDPIHKIFGSIKKGYDADQEWKDVKTFFQKSRNVFINSHQRHRDYRSFLNEREQINDSGDLKHIFDNLLPGEIEELLEAPVINASDEIRINVNGALDQTVGYNNIPPKLIDGMSQVKCIYIIFYNASRSE